VLTTGARPDGSRRQTTRTFRTLGAARAWVAETRTQVARGTFTAPDRGTLAGLCERWLTARRDVREVTRNGYRQVLRPVVGRLGQRRVQDIGRADVEALVDWLGSEGGQRGHGLGHRSVVYTLGTLRQVLAYGVAEGLLPANPAEGVRAPREQHSDNRRVTVWDPADVVRFRRVADADAWAAGWRLTLCGLRRSEVLGLSWRSVDLDAGTVRVEASRVLLDGHRTAVDQPKSAASRRAVPVEAMHAGTVALMRSARASQAADRLAAGPAYTDTGLCWSTRWAPRSGRRRTATVSGDSAATPACLRSGCTTSGTRWRWRCTGRGPHRLTRQPCSGTQSRCT